MAAAVAREAAHGEDENRALRGLVEELKARPLCAHPPC